MFNYLNLKLKTKIIKPYIIHFQTIDSTNTYLLNNNHLENGTVVLADYQTSGRGRRGRKWESNPEESLLFSILLLKHPVNINLMGFTFASAVGVAKGLIKVLKNQKISLKWPNDVLLNDKKVCGILVESRTTGNNLNKVVIGIGININQPRNFFTGNRRFGTSILIETEKIHERIIILKGVLKELDRQLRSLFNSGLKYTIDEWKKYCDHLGKTISINDGHKSLTGILENIENDGAIVLKFNNGEKKRFISGDVTIHKESIYATGNRYW
ncbi:MAG: biotin--[acetyl-CoA-carboxylase] ligase [Candidatus Marinimicrobia bacterium]|nr:biotin--[acetyl-CoA-carboxylase] ligase [Candidatus Neomarinimicrobiota bacterium]